MRVKVSLSILALLFGAAIVAGAAVAQDRQAQAVPDQTAMQAFQELAQRISMNWHLNCEAPGARDVNVDIGFVLSPNGRVTEIEWLNRREDATWVMAADAAMAAINRGQPYMDLPPALYNRKIKLTFAAQSACQGL